MFFKINIKIIKKKISRLESQYEQQDSHIEPGINLSNQLDRGANKNNNQKTIKPKKTYDDTAPKKFKGLKRTLGKNKK